jgi:DNA primase
MEDQLYQGDQGWKLVVVEGPFDALKLDYYGYHERVRTTCTFGTSMTMEQIGIINEVSQLFDHTYLLFDPEAITESFNARDWLIGQRISVAQVPDGIEDPGAFSKEQAIAFIKSLK